MKKDVKSWEFWAVVTVGIIALYLLWQAFQAAEGTAEAIDDTVNAPANLLSQFTSWLSGLFSGNSGN
jgi:hypothetical protein